MNEHPFRTPEYHQRLRELQEVDFVLLELNLYLDTHPNDQQAIQQFNHYVSERMKLAQAFQEQYGPLMNYGHWFSGSPFTWAETPWPWQI
ncbi:spore coat protein CotJB [Paenibacillus aquistagni]|uniref:spore coat protein CotJB n=1 Tax=Paenibacillus aquistagni TaxID=1852522 RepID=UPI00145B850D|nr:spore coat protein CotJB [Paenibacillus aquistagni]NMM51330.1 spore coat protein CotJB [Paenibacillus aquistagni]